MVYNLVSISYESPIITFPDLPLMTTDFITMGFAPDRRIKDDLMLGIAVRYDMEDTLAGKRYPITEYHALYKVMTDGTISTPTELYPVCSHAVSALMIFLTFYLKPLGIPPRNLHAPPISLIENDLRWVMDWFHTH